MPVKPAVRSQKASPKSEICPVPVWLINLLKNTSIIREHFGQWHLKCKIKGRPAKSEAVAVERTISDSVAVIYELDKFVYGGKMENPRAMAREKAKWQSNRASNEASRRLRNGPIQFPGGQKGAIKWWGSGWIHRGISWIGPNEIWAKVRKLTTLISIFMEHFPPAQGTIKPTSGQINLNGMVINFDSSFNFNQNHMDGPLS